MKYTRILVFTVMLILLPTMTACVSKLPRNYIASDRPVQTPGQIYLYGEQHSVEKILDKEFEIWRDYYNNEHMRHLFVEYSYFTAEFLNIWMQSDNDDILNAIYKDWAGTSAQNPIVKEFYKKIKNECPETVFHGTDVGHQYNTTGARFLKYLEDNGMEGSEQYLLAQESIEQGKYFYRHSDDAYRENKMAENFIREFDKLDGESIMGIYGGAHTGLDAMDYNTQSVPGMANQLKKRYDSIVHSEDLIWLTMEDIDPYRTDIITVNGKEYEAIYYGKQDLNGFKDYAHREYWRLENAYDDFKDRLKTGNVLPYNNYPMVIETGQVFVLDYTKTDGSVERMFYRSDGYVWGGRPSTEEFIIG